MNKKIYYIGISVLAAILGALGQLMFKYSLNIFNVKIDFGFVVLLFGIILYGLSTLAYFYVLSKMHLSWAYSIGGTSYIITVIFSKFILLENVPYLRWLGVFVILSGIIIVGWS